MKKQQTAVEWFFEELRKHYQMYDDEIYSIMVGKYVLAKEMERKQKQDAFDESRLTHPMIGFKHLTFEDYYNETYGDENQP